MFYGKRRQMRIGNEIAGSLPIDEHLPEYRPMLIGGSNDSCTRLLKPALYPGQGLFKGEWVFEDPGIGSDPDECGQNRPAQANRLALGKLFIPPFTGLLVQ